MTSRSDPERWWWEFVLIALILFFTWAFANSCAVETIGEIEPPTEPEPAPTELCGCECSEGQEVIAEIIDATCYCGCEYTDDG